MTPLVIFGTRPEAIKLAPVILEMRRRALEPVVCNTMQHRDMSRQVLAHFGIAPMLEMDVMRRGQSLAALTSRLLDEIDHALQMTKPDCVVVQGDTTTVFAASLAAFYRQIPVVHVEAGLRTGNMDSPWPEEFNRRATSMVARLHCAPTHIAADALRSEGIVDDDLRVTGNTGIDALLETVTEPRKMERCRVLVTAHRRESHGDPLRRICRAIRMLASLHPSVYFTFPVHPSPTVQETVIDTLSGIENVFIIPPMDYGKFALELNRSDVVITDSGGVQEEAVTLGCHVLVTRDHTERSEALHAGLATLVGTEEHNIVRAAEPLLIGGRLRERSQIFGDGLASRRVVNFMMERFE